MPAPRITVDSLEVGEVVDAFHRYCQDPNGYYMVQHRASGILHPSIGKTDGWTTAKVSRYWSIQQYNPADPQTWVEIQWLHPTWYNRRGHRLDVSKVQMITQRVPAEQIRQKDEASEAQQLPCLSLFQVRWGGERHADPVTEGAGGWGQIGSTPSDNYINGWESAVFNALGPSYEIVSAFIQNSDELALICPQLVRHLLTGQLVGALYFLWPIIFQDGHDYPAYVQRDKLFDLLVRSEGSGIPTRFPHPSHLYRIFASKEWTAQMCLHPLLRVPLTTRVSREAVAANPGKATSGAIQALAQLAATRSSWASSLGQEQSRVFSVQKGVAKLGWSWEAMDVMVWRNKQELQGALCHLLQQPGSLMDHCFVQEWVDFDVEMRHFVVEADLSDPMSWKPKKIVYTVMKNVEDGCFRNFDRFDRGQCLATCFHHDDAALIDAEQQAEELIHRWLQWLAAQSADSPVVVRFDILAKRLGPGRAAVTTGELTELGGCFLGWPEGPSTIFAAMVRSCMRLPPAGD